MSMEPDWLAMLYVLGAFAFIVYAVAEFGEF